MVMNIMMDPQPMFPNLYHPRSPDLSHDLKRRPKQYSRTERPTRYFLIDFGISRQYSVDNPSPSELPIIGGDKTVPEFQDEGYDKASNPFPTDVYYLGNLIREHYLKEYIGLGFMDALVAEMTQTDPLKRPTMSEVVERFNKIRLGLSSGVLRRRIVSKEEGTMSRVFLNVKHALVSVGYMARRLNPVPEPKCSS